MKTFINTLLWSTPILFALLLITCLEVFAGGLYDETQTPIAGTVQQYKRMPVATISNPLNGAPSIEMVTENVKLYPDGTTQTSFSRRVVVLYTDFAGKNYPLYNPLNGTQIGVITGDTLYSLLYSTWILGEKKADGQVGLLASDPTNICYATSTNATCILPVTTISE